jgi:hypothetical protein
VVGGGWATEDLGGHTARLPAAFFTSHGKPAVDEQAHSPSLVMTPVCWPLRLAAGLLGLLLSLSGMAAAPSPAAGAGRQPGILARTGMAEKSAGESTGRPRGRSARGAGTGRRPDTRAGVNQRRRAQRPAEQQSRQTRGRRRAERLPVAARTESGARSRGREPLRRSRRQARRPAAGTRRRVARGVVDAGRSAQ